MNPSEAPWLDCEVVCDAEPRPLRLALRLPAAATVADAMQAARAAWTAGVAGAIDWQCARIGIWGEECGRERRLQPGDRVEIYRSLLHDPRDARRRRASPGLRRRAR